MSPYGRDVIMLHVKNPFGRVFVGKEEGGEFPTCAFWKMRYAHDYLLICIKKKKEKEYNANNIVMKRASSI